jgi:carbamoyltransferase
MRILGLSPFKHDTAAALFADGAIQSAMENDKILRSASNGIPEAAIEACLEKAGIKWDELDAIAVAANPYRDWWQRSRSRLSPSNPIASTYHEVNELGGLARELNLIRMLRMKSAKPIPLSEFDHYLSHAANAFYLSPFDKSLILTLDEEGDGICGTVMVGEGTRIRVLHKIPFPHSLGLVYSQITRVIGLVPHKDEHKTQWLSLEGEPEYKNLFLAMLRNPRTLLPHLNSDYVNLAGRLKFTNRFYREIGAQDETSELSETQRRNLARSLQDACAEIIASLVERLRQQNGIDSVCFSGGIFQNTLLVSALDQRLGMQKVYVPPAPGNSGCAVGAALLEWHRDGKNSRIQPVTEIYGGATYRRSEIKDVLDNCKARYSLHTTEERKLDYALQLLEAGKIIGWFQGAAEFGPRALGNRSLLASPWAPYVRENLNDFIKHREWFRPFALSIPEEDCDRYFECSGSCFSMNSLAVAKPDADILPEGFLLPGRLVRLHVVRQSSNHAFWRLLKHFGERAKAPILVNTSFNLFGEPLVVKPRDAVRSYFCSGIDALIIDNFVLSKSTIQTVPSGVASAHAS